MICIGSAALAQGARVPTTLFADSISYDPGARTLTADGHVEVYYKDAVLRAERIVYHEDTERITATGPLVLVRGDAEVVLAETAEISADLKEGLIKSARVLMASRLQIAARELQRTGGRYTTLYNTVASSCRICEDSPTPVWQVRARRIVHDTEHKRLYFEGATIQVFGLPVAYLPVLRTPDPTVDRASGFLSPTLSTSDIVGYGVKIPYFLTLGDSADITFAPFITSEGAFVLEGEYRRRLVNGRVSANAALSLDDGLGGGFGRGFVNATGKFTFPSEYRLAFDLNLASDKSFMRQFDYSSADRLTSEVSLARQQEASYSHLAFVGFQTLRDGEDNNAIPYVLPEYQYRRRFSDTVLGGSGAIEADAVGLYRKSGRDMIRLGGGLEWRRDLVLPAGVIFGARFDAQFDSYRVWDDPAFDSEILARAVPTVAAELRWPFAKSTGKSLQIIEPVAQLVYSPGTLGSSKVPNEDSQQIEFDTSNLFALDRFPGEDQVETGFRVNVGVNYTLSRPDSWSLGLIAGKVFRPRADRLFSAGSGLQGASSDIVATAILEMPPFLNISNSIMFDDDLAIKRDEARFSWSRNGSGISGTYAFLSADSAASAFTRRHEIHLSGYHRFKSNWKLGANLRRDLVSGTNTSFGGTLSYANECIKVDFSAERRFTFSQGVPPSDTFKLEVQLAGLGGSADASAPVRKCRRR